MVLPNLILTELMESPLIRVLQVDMAQALRTLYLALDRVLPVELELVEAVTMVVSQEGIITFGKGKFHPDKEAQVGSILI